MKVRTIGVAAVSWMALMGQSSCGPAGQVASQIPTLGEITTTDGQDVRSTEAAGLLEPARPEEAPSPLMVPCIQLVAATNARSGRSEVMYSAGCLADRETTPTQLWVWNQATQNAVPLPLPEDIRGPRPSSDMGMVLFRRETNDLHQELWVVDTNGSNEHRIATISLEEIHQRFPAAQSIGMEYGWVQDTHIVFYETRPLYDLELGPLDSGVLVEATSGVAVSVIPRGEVTALKYSPDGTQLAALSPSQLRLIDASNGQIQSTASLGWNSGVENPLQYSPDGRILTVLTDNGVAIVDTATGKYQEVLFEYLLWGAGDWFLFVPPFHWRDPSTALMLVAPPFEVDEQALDVFTELLDWDFAVYLLDAFQGSITVTQSFRGIYPSAKFSPDLNYLAYERAIPDSETRELYVADLSIEVQVLYATGNQISFISWAPDSSRFFFAVSQDRTSNVYLGRIGQEPMKFDIRPDSITWLDDAHFVGKPASSDLELHLYTVWGEDTVIASDLPSE